MDNSFEILPKGEDGTYYNEHIQSFIAIKRIMNEAERIKKMKEDGTYIEPEDQKEKIKKEELKEVNNEKLKDTEIKLLSPNTVITPNDPSKIIKPAKEFEGIPTAREIDNDPLSKKPFYDIDFRFPEKIKNKKILQEGRSVYHSNELSLEDMQNIVKNLKENPKTFKSRGQRLKERKARRQV